jgi:hypothetical protein
MGSDIREYATRKYARAWKDHDIETVMRPYDRNGTH